MNERFINLTPHDINVDERTVPTCGQVARCQEISYPVSTHAGVELINRIYGEVLDLPKPEQGVIYIVSAMVRMALPYRNDLASPGDLVRDKNGQITGCKNLVIN
jgi:hypothetical protein